MGEVATFENGIYRRGAARLSDLAGYKALPIGNSNFEAVVRTAVFVDKSMLIADLLRSRAAVTLFCRPRRFGKSLNLSMLQRFFEIPVGADAGADFAPLFQGLAIWEAEGGRFREHQGAYPVVRLALNSLKCDDAEELEDKLAETMAREYKRHGYLAQSDRLNEFERHDFAKVASGEGSRAAVSASLLSLTVLLHKHYGRQAVVLIDEYDAPVMAAYTNGFYDKAVSLMKGWLTGALKDNPSLAFAVMTGVQRISKESIFSDLNNLKVDTPLNVASDERFGFTQAEVEALADYLGMPEGVAAAREWYDGYRFGSVDVYNPWSALSYFDAGCVPDVYWGNTSSNGVLGDMVRGADDATMGNLCRLMEPGGTVEASLDTRVVFPDVGVRSNALWSMLYLSGYVTTDDTELPGNAKLARRLRIPNYEVANLFGDEIIERFETVAGGSDRLADLHRALVEGDAEAMAEEMEGILLNSASYFDLVSENSYHMLIAGLLFGVRGYGNPLCNRERGRGRFDVQLIPNDPDHSPLITVELKFAGGVAAAKSANGAGGGADAASESLTGLAENALAQIASRAYDVAPGAAGALRWGLAFSGKSVAAVSERID